MKRIFINSISHASITALLIGASSSVFASDFNIPFVNAAGLGTAYADWATANYDASAAYTNPAGLTNIKNIQLVVAALGLSGSTRFNGTTTTLTFPFPLTITQSGKATSSLRAFMPSFYMALPIDCRFVFGFGVTSPFALGTNYGATSIVRFAATRSQVIAQDGGPSLGVKIIDGLSLGVGADVVRLAFRLNNVYGPPLSIPLDAPLQNYLSGYGYGYHAGVMYQFMPLTRIGASFNSRVQIHTDGTSTVFNPFPPGRLKIDTNRTNAALPARAQLSLQQDLTDRITLMGTAFYTNWKTFNKITMQNVITPTGAIVSVTVPFEYHDTFDYSIGATYKATDKWLFRAGFQWMNTPSNDRDRGVADPIGSAKIIGVGFHYQQNRCLGYDLAYGHSFFKQEPVNFSNALTSASGHNNTSTDVWGAQVNWNIAYKKLVEVSTSSIIRSSVMNLLILK